MTEPESAFRQQFSNWNNRFNDVSSSSRPVLAEWTDYVKTNANQLYTSLPSYNTNAQAPGEEPSWYKLSRFEKIVGFGCCMAASMICFIICFFMFPVLALRPRKFGLLWSMGSLLFVASFGILQGPRNYMWHLVSAQRIPFTVVFFASVLSTLYCAVVLKSTVLTIVTSIVEIFAILYYMLSYFPFGAQTLTWFTSYMVGYFGGFLSGII